MEEEKEQQQPDDSIGTIVLFVIGIYILCCVYVSVMFDYYPNNKTTILKHDKYSEKVTAIKIEQGKPESTDILWNLLFRYRYMKNEKDNALVRIDKFKQKAIYLVDENAKYTVKKVYPKGSLLYGYEE